MNIFSLTFKIIGAVLVTVVIAIGVIIATVDPNDYRGEITELVKKETGRDLQIQSLSLSFFPRFGLTLENTTLSNATGFTQPNFFHIDTVQLGAAILPLLSQKLEIDTLTVHGLTLNLEKNAKGITNWADLIKSDEKTDNSKEDKPAESTNPLDALASLQFGGLDIQQGTIHWQDQQAKQNIQLKIHDFSTGEISFGEFFNIALSAETTLTEPKINTALTLDIEAKIEKNGAYAIQNLTLKTTTTGSGIPVQEVTKTLSIPTLNLALENNQITLPTLTVDYNVIGGEEFPLKTITGKLNVNEIKGDLSSQAFSAQQFNVQTHLTGDSVPNGKQTISLTMHPSLNLSEQTASLSQLILTVMGVEVTGSVKATQITSDARVSTQLNIAQTNLRALFKQLDIALPEMADSQTLTKFSGAFNIDFNAKTQAINVKTLALTLDDSQLNGNASVSQFDRPNIKYNLSLNQLDLNQYLPPPSPKEQPKPTAPSSSEEAEIVLPAEFLKKLTLNGTVKVGALTFEKLQPKNIVITLKGQGGHILANPIKMDIFKTQVHAQAGVDVRNNKQKFSFKLNSQNIPIGDALMAVADLDKLGGSGSVDLNITTAGSSIANFKQNLNGTVATNLIDGFIKGFNLAQSVREAQAKMTGKTLPPNKEDLQTDFSSLIAKASINQGVITTQELSAQIPFMRVSGSGKINLPKESLNYLVRAKIVASDKGQGGEELQSLNGLTIPIRLKGSYLSPKISLDISGLLAEKTKAELEQKKEEFINENKEKFEQQKEQVIEETKEKAEEQIKEQLEDVLKGFKF